MTITYRKLIPGDSRQYRKIRLESLKDHPESFGASYEKEKMQPKLRFEEMIETQSTEAIMIGAFGKEELIGICGFVAFTLDDILNLDNAGTIIQMYVRIDYSGQKIGLNLINATVQQAFKIIDIDMIISF